MSTIRYYDPEYLHEVTQRTIGGRYLFAPDNHELREAILGALAQSLGRYGVKVLAFQFMSNHYHALFKIPSAEKFSRFLCHFHAGAAAAYHRVCQSEGKIWSYVKWNPVANEEETIRKRLLYIMGQAVSAGLVGHPADWTGASSISAMLAGEVVRGVTFKATQRCRELRRKAGARDDAAYRELHTVRVTPPDCWAGLHPHELRAKYLELADSVVQAHPVRSNNSLRLCQPPKTYHKTATVKPPYVHGPVTPKRLDTPLRRPGRAPYFLASDPAHVAMFAEHYARVVRAYASAKRTWRSRAAGRCLPQCQLPTHTLVGTMPFVRSPAPRRAAPSCEPSLASTA